MKKILWYFLILGIIPTFGCAPLEPKVYDSGTPETDRVGIYHKVQSGETLWRIAKAYNVPVGDISKANNIPNETQIVKDQLLFIPGVYVTSEDIVGKIDEGDDFMWPIQGKVVSYFGESKGARKSKGIDINADETNVVKAARTGTVVFADYLPGYEYTVIMDHGDSYHSVYSNNAKLLVKVGEKVQKGRPIAQVLHRDDLTVLHFEIRRNSLEENPLYYLPEIK